MDNVEINLVVIAQYYLHDFNKKRSQHSSFPCMIYFSNKQCFSFVNLNTDYIEVSPPKKTPYIEYYIEPKKMPKNVVLNKRGTQCLIIINPISNKLCKSSLPNLAL